MNSFMRATVIAWLVRFAGLIALFSVPFKHLPGPVESWLPFDPDGISHFAAILLGFALLYIAGQLARQKYTAYLLAISTFGLLIGFELLHHRNPLQILLYIAILCLLIASRKQYAVRSDFASTRRVLLLTSTTLIITLLLASVAFFVIDQKELGIRLTTKESLNVTIDSLLGSPIPSYLRAGREDVFLIDMIRVLFYIALAIILYGIFRPIRLRYGSTASAKAEALRLVTEYSNSSEDYFKLWPTSNKHYFFYKNAFLAYGVKNGVALVLDGCTGDTKDFKGLRHTFIKECRLNGWDIAVLHADTSEAEAWEQLQAQSLYIGSEARVDIANFQSITTNKHFRYIRNKAAKEGLRVEFWEQGLSKGKLAILKDISDAWLAEGDRREYTFAMGYFDETYLVDCACAVLYRDDTPVAYINFIPTYYEGNLSIDHMRFIAGLSSVAMHYLLLETLKDLHSKGAKTLNLGLAPLSKLSENAESVPERLLSVIKRLGGRYYSFSGLEQFKNKFEPTWEQRYLVYFGPVSKLVPIGLALNSLMAYKTTYQKPRIRFVLPLVIIAAIGYASWPLALVLNPAHAFNGLVSLLSSSVQPFAWVFSWLDYISGFITTVVFSYLYIRYRQRMPRLLAVASLLLAISGLASLVAAIVELPASFTATTHITLKMIENPAIVTHGLASFINTLTYTAAIILWCKATTSRLLSWRVALTVTIALLVTIGFVIGQLFMDAGYAIQRLQILLYAIWLVWFTIDVLAFVAKPTKD